MTELATGRIAADRDDDGVVVRLLRPAREPSAPRMVLLHGLAGSGTVWQGLARELSADCELWTAEMPWRAGGAQAWARQEDVGQWAARALAGVPGGADVVVAHSFSADVLLAYLDDAGVPAGLRGLVLVSPFYRARPDEFDWAAISYYLNDFHRILAEGIRIRSGGGLDPDRQQDMALHVRDRVGPYGWVRFFDTYLRSPRFRLDRLSLPCLVVAGERDFAAFPADAIALAAALPDASVHVLPGCGHFAMTERATDFAALTTDFLASIDHGRHRP